MAAPQLERSVLEGKERDELFAIADALGLEPTPRAKKGDLVATILQATGVEDVAAADPPPKARRTRKKAAPTTDAEPADDGDAAAEAQAVLGDGVEPVPAEATAPDAQQGGGPDGDEDEDDDTDEADGGAPGEPVGAAAPQPAADAGPSQSTPPLQQRPLPPRPQNQQPQSQPQNQQPQGQQPQAQQPAGEDGEGGSRRSRRRRGRDRVALGPGYEQQASHADQTFAGEATPVSGILDVRPEGFGFLRAHGHLPSQDDVYVSMSQLRRFGLRAGDRIEGGSRPASSQEKFPALVRIDAVAGLSPDDARARRRFEDLPVRHPRERLALGTSSTTTRAVDLLAPLGKGQRAVVAGPPRSGKSTLLVELARAVEVEHPATDVVVVLLDAHPEDVAEIGRVVRGDVIGSSFDRPAEEHAHVADLAVEVAKRRVEAGGDVLVLLDGLTSLARAHLAAAPGGRAAGLLDPAAMLAVKRAFGAARGIEGEGSLTMVATLVTGSGSPLDAAIADELLGTATMELHLDGALAEECAHPALRVARSSTRHDELLLPADDLERALRLRREVVALEREGRTAEAHAALLAGLG